MKAGAAQPLTRVPSRPSFSKPPFTRPHHPHNIPPVRPTQEGPSTQDMPIQQEPVAPNRPLEQDLRPNRPDQERRSQERRHPEGSRAGRGRGPGRRRRPDRPAQEPQEDDIYDRMVTVSGFPKYTRLQDLLHAFMYYGTATVERIAGHTATMLFAGPDEAEEAVRFSRMHYVYGHRLTVEPYRRPTEAPRDPRKREANKDRQKGPTVDPNTLSWEGSFDTQLNELLTAVRLTQSDLQKLQLLYEDLNAVLQKSWPGCQTVPFGSVTTGLGVKWSDADCFVLLPEPAGAARQHAVVRARRLLAAQPGRFARVVPIPHANTPIVKFYHLPTATHCDVSFKTTLGVRNSELIGFLLSADPRLVPVAVLLKCWASVHELSGTGRLTNYALTMMLIFYLQQPPDPVLPSVRWLQRDPAVERVVDDWNTGIATDRLPPNGNALTLAELIGGFFSFYARFDFEECVVCPFLGRTVQKCLFRDPTRLPEEFALYRANLKAGCPPIRHGTPFCVQDPFEQCHNVASAVSSRFAGDVIKYFKFAAEAYEAEKGRDCKDFLRKILLEHPPLARPRGKAEFRVTVHPSSLAGVPAEGWRDAVEDVVKLIFDSILQLKLEPVNKANKPGDDSLQCHPKNPKRVKYTGVITRAIWKRKQFSKLYSAMRLSLCDRERSITQEILATNNNVLDIPFQLITTFIDSPRGLVLTVRSRAEDLQTFKEFGKFFRSVTAHWFNVLVKKDHSNKLPTASASTTEYEDLKPVDGNDDNANGVDDVTDSDSDSTEDERTPDVQTEFTETNKQSDGEKSPSDTDKENVEETNNVGGKTATPNKPQGSKAQNDKTKNNTNKRNYSKKS